MRNKLLVLLLIVPLALGACSGVPTPENVREAYVAAEFQFQATVDTANDMARSGLIQAQSPEGQQILDSLMRTRFALDAWRAALDDPLAQTTALRSIRVTQALLESIRRNLGDPA